MTSWLSILSLYNSDPTIFDGMTVPSGVDKAQLIGTICLQNAELSLIYPDAFTMKQAIALWSDISQYSWTKLSATLSLEYNPLWNKDGTITESETIETEGSAEGETTGKVSAFNETTFQNRDQSSSESSNSGESTRSYTRTEQGNIGLTSSQELLKQEREVADWSIYDAISGDFRNRFCIMVY